MSVRPVVSLVFRTFKRKAVVKAGGNEWGKEEETHDELVLRLGLKGFTIKRGPKIQGHVYFLFAQKSVQPVSINEKGWWGEKQTNLFMLVLVVVEVVEGGEMGPAVA